MKREVLLLFILLFACDTNTEEKIQYDDINDLNIKLKVSYTDSGDHLSWPEVNIEHFEGYNISRSYGFQYN